MFSPRVVHSSEENDNNRQSSVPDAIMLASSGDNLQNNKKENEHMEFDPQYDGSRIIENCNDPKQETRGLCCRQVVIKKSLFLDQPE